MRVLVMNEVALVGKDPEAQLMGEVVTKEGCRQSFVVTETDVEDTLENSELEQIVYKAPELVTGFVRCGVGTLDGEDVNVYYVIDNGNRSSENDALFVLE